ncbi:MAG: YdeI/OmpD-associated family protein [Actinobacteria bacterium]|nr:YdeI/OmpD-associated family protein [Actinomycetota bacterium]
MGRLLEEDTRHRQEELSKVEERIRAHEAVLQKLSRELQKAGEKQAYGEQFWLQKFTPRSDKSVWSKINKEKALALIKAGKMQPAGLEQIERAKSDGRWDAAYDSASKATVPLDLQSALDGNTRAKAFFGTLDSRNRYAVLFRIQTAKKAETRAKRISQFVQMLERHEKIYP